MTMHWIDLFFLIFFLALNSQYAMLIGFSIVEVVQRKASKLSEFDKIVLSDKSTPPISIIAPAYNEDVQVVESVHGFLQVRYPNLQVIVVNDGSTDDTLVKLKEAFKLRPVNRVVRREIETRPIQTIYQSQTNPNLTVVDKVHGGKADALNVGLNVSQTPLVSAVDSDTLLDPNSFLRMVEPFLYDTDVVAVGGAVYIANTCDVEQGLCERISLPNSWLAKFQVVEYLRSFLFGRIGFNRLGGSLIVAGAFGLYLRESLVQVGGYRHDTVGEDMELIVRLHHKLRKLGKPYKIKYLPDPISYTAVPEDVTTLGIQRDRWQRGLAESLFGHSSMFFNPRYGITGLITYPIYFFFELLGPAVELAGYIWFIYSLIFRGVNTQFTILFLLVAIIFGFLLSLQSLMLDALYGNVYKGYAIRLRMVAVAFLELFGYRQLTLFYRIRGLLKYFFGAKAWGEMKRKEYKVGDKA